MGVLPVVGREQPGQPSSRVGFQQDLKRNYSRYEVVEGSYFCSQTFALHLPTDCSSIANRLELRDKRFIEYSRVQQ